MKLIYDFINTELKTYKIEDLLDLYDLKINAYDVNKQRYRRGSKYYYKYYLPNEKLISLRDRRNTQMFFISNSPFSYFNLNYFLSKCKRSSVLVKKNLIENKISTKACNLLQFCPLCSSYYILYNMVFMQEVVIPEVSELFTYPEGFLIVLQNVKLPKKALYSEVLKVILDLFTRFHSSENYFISIRPSLNELESKDFILFDLYYLPLIPVYNVNMNMGASFSLFVEEILDRFFTNFNYDKENRDYAFYFYSFNYKDIVDILDILNVMFYFFDLSLYYRLKVQLSYCFLKYSRFILNYNDERLAIRQYKLQRLKKV